jgi:ABC-type multidrug transport system fused ATPase/permease subunit
MKTVWRILGLLRNHLWLTLLGFALAFAQMGLGLVIPRVIQLTIDDALIGGDTSLLVTYGLALLGIAGLRFIVGVGRRLASGKVSLDIEYELRNRLWAHLLRQSFAYFDRWPTGQLMSRAMSDVQNVRMFLGYGLVFFASNVILMLAVAVILLTINWRLALLSFAFVPFLLLATIRFGRRLQPILKDVQQRIADVTAAAEENVVGSRIVRIFAREDDELEKFADRSHKVFQASVAAAHVRAIYVPLTAFIPNAAIALLLFFGGRQVIDGGLSLGELVAFYSYLMMLVYPAQVIGWLTSLAQRAIASGERVYQVLDTPLAMTERPDARPLRQASPAGTVRFDAVSLDFEGRSVLRDVSLLVPAGRTVALVGRTGSGKTTLTNLIPRFYDPDSGRVLIDDQDVRDLRLAAVSA